MPRVDLNGIELVDSWSEVVGVSPECNLQQRKELVHASEQHLWPGRQMNKPLRGEKHALTYD